ncbi:hypothetical protein FA15DRAFT_317245 [Coprinopsis marcescibilis]|uniref:Uncharacterized protein n=1 Tax=Coprinopsis marcescibilis TaxID=230819 RepID=A0A5C3KCF1_COPMA|nr:hypothetical protein FA15DRAFT_317245 [Coprinopsis marcescibilis]
MLLYTNSPLPCSSFFQFHYLAYDYPLPATVIAQLRSQPVPLSRHDSPTHSPATLYRAPEPGSYRIGDLKDLECCIYWASSLRLDQPTPGQYQGILMTRRSGTGLYAFHRAISRNRAAKFDSQSLACKTWGSRIPLTKNITAMLASFPLLHRRAGDRNYQYSHNTVFLLDRILYRRSSQNETQQLVPRARSTSKSKPYTTLPNANTRE